MEVAVLKGLAGAVGKFAEQVIAERGVRHGQLVVLPSGPAPPARRGAQSGADMTRPVRTAWAMSGRPCCAAWLAAASQS